MAFKKKYKDKEFLDALSTTQPRATAYVMRKLGCVRNTAKPYLQRLEAEGKIRKVEVCGNSYFWLRVEQEE